MSANKCITKITFVILALATVAQAQMPPRDVGMRSGHSHGGRHGNENSRPVRDIRTGPLTHGGNGCPDGTMQIVFAPDNLSFSILYDQFIAEVADGDKHKRDAMACDAIVPIQLPDSMQMEITRVDFRGFVGLPADAQAQVHSFFNFRGSRRDHDSLNLLYNFTGPVTDDYEISSDVLNPNGQPPDTEISPCGGIVQLRIFTRLRVLARDRTQATLTLDSIDGSAQSIYYVNWRVCQNQNTGHNGDHNWNGRGDVRGDGRNQRNGDPPDRKSSRKIS